MSHGPGRQVAAIRAAHDGGLFRVRIAAFDRFICDRFYIGQRRATPVAFDGFCVRFPLAFGAARVGIRDNIPRCGQPLQFME